MRSTCRQKRVMRRGAQAQLHRMAAAQLVAGQPQQPGHHALHVLELQMRRGLSMRIEPWTQMRAQVQVAHAVVLGNVAAGKGGVRRLALAHCSQYGARLRHERRLRARRQLALERPTRVGRAGRGQSMHRHAQLRASSASRAPIRRRCAPSPRRAGARRRRLARSLGSASRDRACPGCLRGGNWHTHPTAPGRGRAAQPGALR